MPQVILAFFENMRLGIVAENGIIWSKMAFREILINRVILL